jgi:hypothetical protein
MNMRFRLALIPLFLSLCFTGQAQKKIETGDDDVRIMRIYQEQYADFLTARGLSRSVSLAEVYELARKNPYEVNSINFFAETLAKLYPTDRGIGVLFFFFNQDTLFRLFFEPGKLVDLSVIPVSQRRVNDLGKDLMNALRVSGRAAARSPGLRGVTPGKEQPSVISVDSALKKACAVLLPSNFDTYRHLIIVPALSIGTFPFQLLKPYGDGSYFIDHCSFSIAPGLTDLVSIRSMLLRNYTGSGEYDQYNPFGEVALTIDSALFVTDPVYPVNTKYFFPSLAGAKAEVQAAIPYAKNKILLEREHATKAEVINALKHCDLAYFATHGIASEQFPMDSSFLVLSGEEDPFLTAKDIVGMRDSVHVGERFNNKFPLMTILSACQTGLGETREAGITGLARSFLIAGSNQVIVSLWSVDDEATAYLMSRFLYYLSQSHLFSPAEPLRLAELDTRARFKSPAQWASFSVFGVTY